ncbi:MAG: recombinase family protein [Planctomycetota bacterium]|jgi:site-specific DNA recombinase
MRRAALYARVSTGLQEKEQTIRSQLAAIARYADQQRLRHTPALTYTDDGYSGTGLDRPALDELRDHAREGRFDVVVVLCPDRLARRYAYQVLLLDELKRAGVEVQFCERPISDCPDDQLLLQIQGAIAEYERAKVLERCRRGRLHRARRGELAPPVPPYGYVYGARKYGGDGQIRIHEEEAALVRQIFRWYAEEGLTVYRIQRRLDASAWSPRRGPRPWSSGTVFRILRCEWYVGRAYYNRVVMRSTERSVDAAGQRAARMMRKMERPRSEWIVVPVPRIIDDAQFERAQQRMEENRRFSNRRLKRHAVYLLKGLLKCGVCGHAYTGSTRVVSPKKWGQSEYHYYACTEYCRPVRHDPSAPRCRNKRLDVAGADEVVWTTVRDLLLDGDALTEQLESWLARTTADPADENRLRLVATRLKELHGQRERLIDAYQSGALDLEDFQRRKDAVEQRTLAVEHEQAELRSWASRRELAGRQVEDARQAVAQLHQQLRDPSFEVKQAILRLVVDKVVVIGQRLEVHLALPVSGFFHLTFNRGPTPTPNQNIGGLLKGARP